MLEAHFVSCFTKYEHSPESELSVKRNFLGFQSSKQIHTKKIQRFSPSIFFISQPSCYTGPDISSPLAHGVQSSCKRPSLKNFSHFVITKARYWYVVFYSFAQLLLHSISCQSADTLRSKGFLPWYLVGGLTWIMHLAQWKDGLCIHLLFMDLLILTSSKSSPDSDVKSQLPAFRTFVPAISKKVCWSHQMQILKWSWIISSSYLDIAARNSLVASSKLGLESRCSISIGCAETVTWESYHNLVSVQKNKDKTF